MELYRWNTEEIFEDIKKLKNNLNSDNELIRKQSLADLKMILNLLEEPKNFDRTTRATNLYTIADKAIKQNMDIGSISKLNEENVQDQLAQIKKINKCSIELLKNINKQPLKSHRRFKLEKANHLETLLLLKATFQNYSLDYYFDFENFCNNGRLYLDPKSNSCNVSYVAPLATLNKTYSCVCHSQELLSADNYIYCFLKSKLYENNLHRDYSIFDKTLETFFYLLYSDKLGKHRYKSEYDIKSLVLQDLNRNLDEFMYITYNNDQLEYDSQTGKCFITKESSLYDDEMVAMYKKGVNLKTIKKSMACTYSLLLALFLYEEYHTNKYWVISQIKKLFENIGRISDLDVIESLNIDINQFYHCDYYDDYVKNCKTLYKGIKKKKS